VLTLKTFPARMSAASGTVSANFEKHGMSVPLKILRVEKTRYTIIRPFASLSSAILGAC